MLDLHMARRAIDQVGYSSSERKVDRVERAQKLYHQARWRAQWRRWLSRFSGRQVDLVDLHDVQTEHRVIQRHDGGLRIVPLAQIVGSQGRVNDFDRFFDPVQEHTEERWFSVALAQMAGIALPPVTLVHVAGAYFVIDGHHRISVARALGQREIEAEVIVWTVATEPAETTAATTSWCSGQMSPLAGTPCITCA